MFLYGQKARDGRTCGPCGVRKNTAQSELARRVSFPSPSYLNGWSAAVSCRAHALQVDSLSNVRIVMTACGFEYVLLSVATIEEDFSPMFSSDTFISRCIIIIYRFRRPSASVKAARKIELLNRSVASVFVSHSVDGKRCYLNRARDGH